MHYSKYKHPHFADNADKWSFSHRVYTGTAYDPEYINDFIPRKVQRESDKAYDERKSLIDPQMNYATGIDSLAGIMIDAEQEADLVWSDPEKTVGLGDPEDRSSVAGKITRDADGNGTNWEFIPKQAAIKFSMYKELWGLVDGRPKNENGDSIGDATVKIIDPQDVPNKFDENGRLTWVLVKELRDNRQTFRDDPTPEEVFTEYTVDGWRRFKVTEVNGEHTEQEIGSGTYEYYRTKDKKEKILPVFRVQIPLPRNPGYLWARKSNSIQNFESRLDFAHMTITFAMLQVACEGGKQFDDFLENFRKGTGVLNIPPDSSRDHKFLDQNSAFFDASEKRLEKKIKDFYQNMFKDYSDAARERTATEVRLESKSGIEAYLNLLVGAVDEFENQALWRISQVYFPNNTDVWGDAHVKRSTDFAPKDIEAALDKLKERYVGDGPLPIDNQTRAQMIKRIIEMDGGEVDEETEQRIEERLDRVIESGLAEALARLASVEGVSTKTIIQALKPNWDDSQVEAELKQVRAESGFEPIPEEQIGG